MKRKNKWSSFFSTIAIALLLTSKTVCATQARNYINSFGRYTEIAGIPSSNFPQVIDLTFIYSGQFAIVNNNTMSIEPVYQYDEQQDKIKYDVTNSSFSNTTYPLSDDNQNTYVNFDINKDGGPSNIYTCIRSDISPSKIYVSGFDIYFSPNSLRPEEYAVKGDRGLDSDGLDKIINKTVYSTDTISFPSSGNQCYRIELYHSQPLRISEVRPLISIDDQKYGLTKKHVRFLALPNNSYSYYYDLDSQVKDYVIPMSNENLQYPVGNKVQNLKLNILTSVPNPNYLPSDKDNDEVVDEFDNCPNTPNYDQADANHNGVGDACDDFDQDGVMNTHDNCPMIPNPDQANKDGDQYGDVCDNEESRVSEKYPWLPWVAIVIGFGVTGGVLFVNIKQNEHIRVEGENTETKP
ncbi:MAG: thrombospondin type 3 repeat-containing protein [Patescibacteria group bacterium]